MTFSMTVVFVFSLICWIVDVPYSTAFKTILLYIICHTVGSDIILYMYGIVTVVQYRRDVMCVNACSTWTVLWNCVQCKCNVCTLLIYAVYAVYSLCHLDLLCSTAHCNVRLL